MISPSSAMAAQLGTMLIVFSVMTAIGAWYHSKRAEMQDKRIEAIHAVTKIGDQRVAINREFLDALSARIDRLEDTVNRCNSDIIEAISRNFGEKSVESGLQSHGEPVE